jgi:HAD superfamily hydrolase (TIGR01509 family)
MFQAVIFDLDGVLIDSEPLWRRAEQEVFRSVGLDLTEHDCHTTTGLRCDDVVAHWFARHPWTGSSPAEFERRIHDRVLALIASEGRPLPGAVEAVYHVRSHGLAMAVASSSSRELIDGALDRLGLGSLLPLRCSSFDETRPKPAPDVYLTAARRLGVAPVACVAVEDSGPGVTSALAAGMRVVAISGAEHTDDSSLRRAHVHLNDLTLFRIPHLADFAQSVEGGTHGARCS